MEKKNVSAAVRKKDAMQLLLGKPVYTEDITPRDVLVVKVLRSPHAHALIEEINTSIAEKVEGVVAIYTYKDVPQRRFTLAGQTGTVGCAMWVILWPLLPAKRKRPLTLPCAASR